MPESFVDVGECVEATLRRLGKRIVLALPLALGKPVPFVNELYRRVARVSVAAAEDLQPPSACASPRLHD
ncbi:MAG: hypothetical protein HC872_08210 [Gammaproteobacteria bacterium]|nr:hypothetical protein [Gammaproteobacteria bacterium]